MNGAAMNCRQDAGLRPPHRDSGSLHIPGYHLQINRQHNLQPQNSKTFSSNCQVDGYYDNVHQYESRHSSRDIEDPRFQRPRVVKRKIEPIDLPVPRFEIDEHSVIHQQYANDASTRGSKVLDLDTRIGLLIKSKALAGMHPIFSDLNDSEESDSDLDDPFLSRPKSKFRKTNTRLQPVPRESEVPVRESFDDPEKPLSRPPSPFLSRATYLFWFNKAIEIKQQARAQEQALLELATKRLNQDTSTSLQTNQPDLPRNKCVPKNLIDEISKELREVIKQEFIREIVEKTAFNTLDDWWEKQNREDEKVETEGQKLTSNKSCENQQDLIFGNLESQGSTSPKMPFLRDNETINLTNHEKDDNLNHESCVEEMSVTKALSADNEERFNYTDSVPRDINSIPDNSATEEHQELWSEKTGIADLKKSSEVKCYEVSTLVKSLDNKIDSCTNDELDISDNLLNHLPIGSNTIKSEVLVKGSEMCQRLHSHKNALENIEMEEKFVIVKDILDFIFNNVNNIVGQRDGNIYQKENENCEPFLNLALASSLDTLLTENTEQGPSKDVTNVLL